MARRSGHHVQGGVKPPATWVTAFLSLILSGCFAFGGDPDDIEPADAATDTESNTDTSSDTDTDGEKEPDGGLDAGPDGGDADADTDTDSDSDTGSESGTDTETDSCHPGPTCQDLGWGCGSGDDGCGNALTCPTCTGVNETCDTNHQCACANDQCKETCCDADQVCNGAGACCTPTTCDAEGYECGIHSDGCDGTLTCSACADGNWCDDDTCKPCNTNDHCGSSCAKCTGTATPFCDTDDGACVECRNDDDCRNGSAAPFNSKLGICTPAKICTCWVENDTDNCTSSAGCPSGFQCARDFDKDLNIHSVCLRGCSAVTTVENGLVCEARATDGSLPYVWVPMTTCYAFNKFNEICTVDDNCRLSGTLGDGLCREFGSGNYHCTYSCWDGSHDDTLCPTYPGDTDACQSPGDYCKVP